MAKSLTPEEVGILGAGEPQSDHACSDECRNACDCGNDYCIYNAHEINYEGASIKCCLTCFLEDKNEPPGSEL